MLAAHTESTLDDTSVYCIYLSHTNIYRVTIVMSHAITFGVGTTLLEGLLQRSQSHFGGGASRKTFGRASPQEPEPEPGRSPAKQAPGFTGN